VAAVFHSVWYKDFSWILFSARTTRVIYYRIGRDDDVAGKICEEVGCFKVPAPHSLEKIRETTKVVSQDFLVIIPIFELRTLYAQGYSVTATRHWEKSFTLNSNHLRNK
jgi:hypothetical protein